MPASWGIEVFEEENGSVLVVTMGISKANVFSIENMDAMDTALTLIETKEEYQDMGVVLAVPEGKKTFSAGLDMAVVMGLDQTTFGEYIGRFDRLMWRLFTLKRPVVAAVTGHAIAGGAITHAHQTQPTKTMTVFQRQPQHTLGFVLMSACDWRVGMKVQPTSNRTLSSPLPSR